MGVSARIGTTNATGIVQPKVGDPNDLLLQYLPANTQANRGEYVVTSGTVSSPDDSLYPPGIPIGQVTSVNEESAYRSVNVHPLADLHNLDVVQVLTAAAGHAAGEPQPAWRPTCPPASTPSAASRRTARLDRRRRMNGSVSAALLVRIAVLVGRRRVLPDRRRLRGAGVRRQRRSVAAAGRLRRPAVRLDDRRRDAASPSACSSIWRCVQTLGVTSLIAHRSSATGPGACASCATRRRR